jgi:hypothetical protein
VLRGGSGREDDGMPMPSVWGAAGADDDFWRQFFHNSVPAKDTCWVFGAGASYDCRSDGTPCVPLMRGLLTVEHLLPPTGEALVNSLEQLRSQHLLHYVTLEQALKEELEQLVDQLRAIALHERESVAELGNASLRHLLNNIAGNIAASQAKGLVGVNLEYFAWNYFFIGILASHNPQMSVLTLNWDMLLDWGLRYFRMNGYRPWPVQYDNWRWVLAEYLEGGEYEPKDGVYMKLHGSLLLYACLNRQCAKYRVPGRYEDKEGEYSMHIRPDKDRTCRACGEVMTELLLPPGENKTEDEGRFLKTVYLHAEHALARSQHWVVVGYSAPDYDADIASLMMRAISRKTKPSELNVVVVSPDASTVAGRLSSRIRHKVLARSQTFTAAANEMSYLMGFSKPLIEMYWEEK